jgi:FkbM family methyltransferase
VMIPAPTPLRRVVNGARHRWDTWRTRDRWWLGRLIELSGDTVTVDGCSFAVNSPIIRTASKSHLLIGDYERGERAAIAHYLDPSLPVIELGGCLGVVASLTNRRLRQPDRHVVVEAHPDLLPLLHQNRDRNAGQFEIVHAAVAYGCDTVTFCEGGNFLAGRLGRTAGRQFTVPAVTLSQLLHRFAFERCTVICDIEGGEADLIRHDREALVRHVSTLIIEWHPYVTGSDGVMHLQRQIESAGFVRVCETGAVSTYQQRRTN